MRRQEDNSNRVAYTKATLDDRKDIPKRILVAFSLSSKKDSDVICLMQKIQAGKQGFFLRMILRFYLSSYCVSFCMDNESKLNLPSTPIFVIAGQADGSVSEKPKKTRKKHKKTKINNTVPEIKAKEPKEIVQNITQCDVKEESVPSFVNDGMTLNIPITEPENTGEAELSEEEVLALLEGM